jgi:hypothetical protein
VGKAYFNVASGLLKADPYLLQTAPTFFGLTIDGSLELAQMAVARLYDKTRGAVTIRTMLHDAAEQLSAFQNATPREAEEVILKAALRVVAIQPILDAIRTRRNEWLAHLDPGTVADPAALAAKAKLTMPDLKKAFGETEKTLVELFSRHQGVFGELEFIGGDDYEMALDWIRSAKCTFIENYEREFGHPLDGPRPRDCSNNLLKMR